MPATPFASPCGQYQFGTQGGVTKLIEYNNELYASGNFNEAGGLIANCIARWNGFNWNTIYQGDLIQNSPVYDMIAFNNKLYFIGDQLYTWDGMSIDTLLYLDQSSGNLTSIPGATSNFCIYNGELYLGAGSVLFKINSNNAITFEVMTGGVTGGVDVGAVTALEVFNGNLYLGSIWGIYKNLNGTWLSITGNTSPLIIDLAVFENHLYALGNFNSIGLISAFNFAKYDGQTWSHEIFSPNNASIMSNQTSSIVIPNAMNVINNTLVLTYPTNYPPTGLPHVFAKQNGSWNEMGNFDMTNIIFGQCYTSCLFQNEIFIGGAFSNGLSSNQTICNLMKINSSILGTSNELENSARFILTDEIISLSNIENQSKIEILNLEGRILKTEKIDGNDIDISKLNSGVYFILINNKDKYKFYKN
jgi:hypothetical protein